MQFSPSDLTSLLTQMAETGASPVIVGGQAVNIHAIKYLASPRGVDDGVTYTSEDLDFFAHRSDALRIIQVLAPSEASTVMSKAAPNMAGAFKWNIGGKSIVVDFLRSISGLTNEMIIQNQVSYSDIPLPVLHPFHCLISKIHNLSHLPQAERQDLKHGRVCLGVMQRILSSPDMPSREVLKYCEGIFQLAQSPDAKRAATEFGLNCIEAIPVELISQSSDEKIRRFCGIRYPQMVAMLSEDWSEAMSSLLKATTSSSLQGARDLEKKHSGQSI